MKSKAWQEMIELGGLICHALGLPRSIGQIYGLIYFSTQPLPLGQMSSMLGISKGSASMGTRQLSAWGAIRRVWIPGDRRDYYEATENLGQLIRGSFNKLIKPRIESSKDRLAIIESSLKADIKYGAIPLDKKEILEGRINALKKIRRRMLKFLPLIEKIIG